MVIKVLGPGCPNCKALDKSVREAVDTVGIAAEISKVEDIVEIMQYGVMSTPALVIDNKVVIKGKVPSVKELIGIISK